MKKELKIDLGVIPHLSILQYLRVQVFHNAFVHWIKPECYSGSVPVYLVKCCPMAYTQIINMAIVGFSNATIVQPNQRKS